MNRGRPAFVIVHPDDYRPVTNRHPGRPLREALALLTQATPPDPSFADDMEARGDACGSTRSLTLA